MYIHIITKTVQLIHTKFCSDMWACWNKNQKHLRSYLCVRTVEGCKYVSMCRTETIVCVWNGTTALWCFQNHFHIHVISSVCYLLVEWIKVLLGRAVSAPLWTISSSDSSKKRILAASEMLISLHLIFDFVHVNVFLNGLAQFWTGLLCFAAGSQADVLLSASETLAHTNTRQQAKN